MTLLGKANEAPIISWIAGIVALVVTLVLPLGYLGVTYRDLKIELAAETEFRSGLSTEYINDNPTSWKDQEHLQAALLTRNPPLVKGQWIKLFDPDGNELASAGAEPPWPTIKIGSSVYDAGVVVGRYEVARSFRHLLWHTAWVALFGLILGAAVFITLRVLPLRALHRATAAIEKEVEQHAEARRQAEAANRAKSQFLAAASHDLRQPMHALGLYAAVLDQKVIQPEARELVEKINASVEALEGLFSELLDISRLDAGVYQRNVSEFPVADLLGRVRAQFTAHAQTKGLELRVHRCRAWIASDPVLLERILINLVSNALRYTARGRVVVGCRRRAGVIRIEVWDTGVGIAAGELPRVFDEFYQVGNPERDRTKGLGLGLAIVRRLGLLLEHTIGTTSVAGKGSCFSVEVPRGQAVTVPTAEAANAAPSAQDASKSMLVVIDDESAVRDSMAVLLREWGYLVVAAGSLEDALEEISRVGRTPDAVLADYRLRDGATGLEAIQRLQQEFGAQLQAAVITGDIAAEKLAEFRESGLRHLHKPVPPARLRELVGALLAATV